MSPYTLKGNFPNLNCIQSVCMPKNRQLQFLCCCSQPFYTVAWQTYWSHFSLQWCQCKTLYAKELSRMRTFLQPSLSHQDTTTKVLQDPSIPIIPPLGKKKSDQQSQEQNKTNTKNPPNHKKHPTPTTKKPTTQKRGRECFFTKKEEIWKLSYTLETEKLDSFTKQLPQTYFPFLNSQ